MRKRLFIIYGLLLSLCSSVLGQTADTKIGDLITNSDGSQGVVFWINPERTKGLIVALKNDTNQAAYALVAEVIPNLTPINGNNINDRHLHALYDMDGYTNTLRLREYLIAKYATCPKSCAACCIDFEKGWFIPSTGIWNLLYATYPLFSQKMAEYGGLKLDPATAAMYWSSTLYDANFAWCFQGSGIIRQSNKWEPRQVRAVREIYIPPKINAVYDTTLTYRWHANNDTVSHFYAKPASDSLFIVTAKSSIGCETTTSKQIFVTSVAPKIIYDTICAGYSYKQNGFDLPADSNQTTGTTTYGKTLSNGICDISVILHLTKRNNDSSAIIDSFCEGKNYVYNGVMYQMPGDYVQFLTCENQCDSLLHLKLSCKYPKLTEHPTETYCGHFVWNNQYYYSSGMYSQTFVAANGCDSVVKKSITICNTTHGYLDLDSCDQITYKGITFFTDTILIDTLKNVNNCDSLLTVSLTVIKSGFDTVHLSDCDSVHYREKFYYSSMVVDTLIDLTACSTLETAFLTVNYSYFNSQDTSGTDSLRYLSKIYYRDTVLFLQYQTVAGCDSVEEIRIFVAISCKNTNGQLDLDSCDQIIYKNSTFFNDTVFVDTLVNLMGCDSLLTVSLTVIKSGFDTVHLSDCDSVYYRGTFYHSSTVVDTLIKLTTCSTLETAFLTVNYSYFNSQDTSGTDSLQYLSKKYYRDTILSLQYQTVAGCDSVEEIRISVKLSPPDEPDEPDKPIEIETEIVVYWHRVLAVPNRKNLDELHYATYYWYKDDILLPQSNKDWIEVEQPIPAGRYNVSIHYGGKEISYLERIFDRPSGISAYPNPLNIAEELTVEAHGNTLKRIEIFDAKGIQQYYLPIRQTITGYAIGGFKAQGVYVLRIYLEDQTIEMIKIVVK